MRALTSVSEPSPRTWKTAGTSRLFGNRRYVKRPSSKTSDGTMSCDPGPSAIE